VAIYYTTLDPVNQYNLASIKANGGGSAAAGTVYLFGTGTPDHGHVMVSNNLVLPDNSVVTLDSITVNNSSVIAIGNNSTITVNDITVTGDSVAAGSVFKIGGGSTVNVTGKILVSGNSTILLQGKNTTAQINGTWAGTGVTINAANVQVDVGSKISADGQGYGTGLGNGTSTDVYSGGSYGGKGNGNSAAALYGSALTPADPGSGGGASGSSISMGGGVIRLLVSGTLTNNGVISSNGTGSGYGSGASGGSIWVTTGTLTGSGIFTGNSYPGWFSNGGGGRVAVYYRTNSGYSGFTTSTATGATNGSIAFLDNSQTNNRLYVYQQFPFSDDTTATYDSITLDNSGTLTIGGGSVVTVTGTVTVAGNSSILLQSKNSSGTVSGQWQGVGVTLRAANIQVDTGSKINSDGQGYGAGQGVGTSASLYTGGSYGGQGSNGGAAIYGSESTPTDLGSGGAPSGSSVSTGGGAMFLIVSDTLTDNGTISANGTGSGYGSGASGGSILLTTGKLTGSGSIAANGFGGWYSNGGGGRVAIYYATSSFDSKLVTASAGGSGAAVGTVVLSNTPKFLWTKPVGDLLHDTGRLEWVALAVDPLTTTVDIVASRATEQHTLGVHLNSNSGFDWDTRSVADGQYELRLIFRDANGLVIGEAPRSVLINNSVTWHWGTIASSETWSSGKVHVIEGTLIIPTGVTITVDPGTVIKAQKGARIIVQEGGIFNALGTEPARITFTALGDDSVGGDTNLDGSQTKPLPGEWFGFGIQGSGQMNLNNYADIRYMQTVRSGTLAADEKWLGSYLYHVTGDVIVPSGVTLTIEPGTVIKFDAGKGIIVQAGGKLIADGTVAQPIWFTSVKDDSVGGDTNNDGSVTTPVAGDWHGLSFGGGLGSLKHIIVHYGGDATGSTAAISATNATVVIANSEVSEGLHEGVLIYSGSVVTIDSSVITGFDRGVNAQTGGQITIRNTTIDGNRFGVLFHGGTMDLANSIVSNSLERGIWSNCCGGPTPIIRYNNVWSATGVNYFDYGANTDLSGTNGNISKNPNFRNREQRDFRLNFLSPAIDAADGTIAPVADMMGAPRFNDPRTLVKTGIAANGTYSDIGAFEFSDNAPSDVDLIVSSVTGPASAVVGGQASLSWTIANKGTGYAVGPWHDTVYLVSNPDTYAVDIVAGEVLVGNNPPLILGPGQSYTASGTIRVPGSVVGFHRWAVKTNSRGEVFEGLNSSNNRSVSATSVDLDLTALTLDGATLSSQFTSVGHSYWYKIHPGAGKDVSVSLKLSGNSGTVQLYIGQGYMPDPQHHDIKSSEWNSATATALIPGSTTQTYYIMATVGSMTGASCDFALAAKSVAFSLTSVKPGTVSNSGSATFELGGGQLNSNARYLLVGPNSLTLASTAIFFDNPAHLYATFSMLGLAAGSNYGIQVVDGGKTVTLNDVITVSVGRVGEMEYTLDVPKALRVGKSGKVTINYRNAGTTDVVAPLMSLTSNGASINQIAPACSGCSPDFKMVYESLMNTGYVLGINNEGPAGVLPAGASGSITLNMNPTVTGGTVSFTLNTIANPDEVIDWASMKESLRPAFVPADAWDAIYANFTASAGTTIGQYNAMLANNATYLSRLGRYEQSTSRLYAFELIKSGLPEILNRYVVGTFGRGGSHLLDVRGVVSTGEFNVHYATGTVRLFVADPANQNLYLGSPGDYGSVLYTNTDKTWTLTEQDGTKLRFVSDPSVAGAVMLASIQSLEGNQATLAYTGNSLTGVTNVTTGDTLSFTYTNQGRISQIVDALNRVTTYTYDASGEHLLSTANDSEGVFAYTYVTGTNAASEHALQSVTYPDGSHSYFKYDARGRLSGRYYDGNADALTVTYGTDGDITITDADGKKSHIMPDEFRKIVQFTDPLGVVSRFLFDVENKLAKIVAPEATTTSFEYDTSGNSNAFRDPAGNHHAMVFERYGRMQSFADALGNSLRFSYDSSFNTTGVSYPDGSAVQAVYDARGNLTNWSNRRKQQISLAYNNKNKLTQKKYSDGKQVDYVYDNLHRLSTATNSSGTTTFAYDTADRLTGIDYPTGRSVLFTYDAGGRRSQLRDKSGFVVNYLYDSVGRLSQLNDGSGAKVVAYSYDTVGRLSRKELGNGTSATYSYDDAGRLTHLVNFAPDTSTVISRFDYTYDTLGRKTAMSTLEGSWAYSYDATGQLITVTMSDSKTVHYTYDAAGNRSMVTTSASTTGYATNNMNQYTSVGNTSYRYDADGNVISKMDGGQNWTYSYDDENRLVAMTMPDGSSRSYEYDCLGNRIAEVNNGKRREYLVDPVGIGSVIAEYEAGVLVSHYTHGLSLVSTVNATNTAYYNFDGSTNTVQMTGPSGSVLNSYAYLPFGEKIKSAETVANPFTFVGQYGVMDNGNGLYFMRDRQYDPTNGRFFQPDKIGLAGGDPNLYRYASNNPVNFIDPEGTRSWGGVIFAAAGAAAFVAIATVTAPVALTGAALAAVVISGAGTGYAVGDFGSHVGDSMRRAREGNADISNMEIGDAAIHKDQNDGKVLKQGLTDMRKGVDLGLNVLGKAISPAIKFPGSKIVNKVMSKVGSIGGGKLKPVVTASTNVIGSWDPNEKATVGYGPAGYVTGFEPVSYTIIFENKSTASAAAQKVVVTDQLDTNLDWSTMELLAVGFNNKTVDIPTGLQSYTTTASVTTDPNPVKVTANLDPATGIITWKMTTFDTATGDLPDDPYAGFLPPNDATHRGEGFVTFRIKAKTGLATSTAITNKAQIFFDVNPMIETNVVTNTIDLTAPTSSVNALPTTTPASFTVSWGGSDTGSSGIAGYDVYVKTDNGAYIPWLTGTASTSATYNGVIGHTYAFYSIATDNVGHRQTQAGSVVSTTTSSAGTKAGDCDANGTVTIAEVQSAINMFLGLKTVALCVDTNGDTTVSIAEVQKTINSFLGL
jgi:RHS repeat-associated protein